VANLENQGNLSMDVAGSAIVIAAVMNTIAKAGIGMIVGAPELRRTLIWALGAVIVVGAISVGVLLFM
jgi:uncharacterized membrane protein (DUF4010 family)